MTEAKTKKSRASVAAFLAAVPDPERRKDARAVAALLRRVTGERAVLWGTNIVGFGTYHYRYASGREGDWPVAAFAPRADRISVYVTCELSRHRELLARLGKHSKGKGCLHIRRLADVDPDVLEELVRSAVAEVRARYPD
jgi:Domain of unknown function (DU1801)